MQMTNSSTGAASAGRIACEPRQCWSLAHGFTLLEIMIVLVIVGITASVAIANLMPSEDDKLQHESERLMSLLQLARDEAVFGGRVIGVAVAADRVEFLERDITDASRWQATKLTDLHARTLPEAVRAQVRIGNQVSMQERPATAENSQIIFLPVGVAAPFDLTLRSSTGMRRITGDAIGNLTLNRDPA
jgi:general secretion pathway protein H